MHARRITLACAVLAAMACDPATWLSDRPRKSPASSPSAVENLEADAGESSIGFAVARATNEHVAQFEDFAAQATLEDSQPKGLAITIQMASVRADRAGLTRHLQSPDFFDVERYPTATFTAKTFDPAPDEEHTHAVTGTLGLHGVERSITFPATIRVSEGQVTGAAELSIDPREYGIDNPVLDEELVDPNVWLSIRLSFPRVTK